MQRYPTGSYPCPKCGNANTLRAYFFVDRDNGCERIKGTCPKCGFYRFFYPRDYEGSE